MKTVYVNYMMLISFEVEDDVTKEEIRKMADDEMNMRCGLSIDDFDDGEIEVL